LRATQLARSGYKAAGKEEMNCEYSFGYFFNSCETISSIIMLTRRLGQIRWRKEDDWRAGSEPLGRPLRTGARTILTAFNLPQELRKSTSSDSTTAHHSGATTGRARSFDEQVKEIRRLEAALQGEFNMQDTSSETSSSCTPQYTRSQLTMSGWTT
jgi:hypothetical protein